MNRTIIATIIACCLAACASAPTPIMPSGTSREPVNSPDKIANYQARTAEEDLNTRERSQLSRDVADINYQIAQIKAALAFTATQIEELQKSKPNRPQDDVVNAAVKTTIDTASVKREGQSSQDTNAIFRVMFGVGKTNFNPPSGIKIDLIKAASTAKEIEIRGRTDGVKDNPIDARIAEMRAASAKQFLIAHGIDGRKIHTDALGVGDNFAENESKTGKAQNRRVEIEIRSVAKPKVQD